MNTNSFWTSSSINSFFNTSTYSAGRSDAFSGLYGSLGDSKLIQSGTYKRLMTKYYEESDDSSASAKNAKKTADTAKTPSSIIQKLEKEREAAKAKNTAAAEKTDTKASAIADTATEASEPVLTLTAAADALQADARELASKEIFTKTKGQDGETGQYDMDKITDAVKNYVKDYNNLLDTAASSKNSGVASNISRIKDKTASNAASLYSIGITEDKNGKLSVDEDKLKSASAEDIQRAFDDYSSAVATNSSLVGYYSGTQAGSNSGYTAQAAYQVQTGNNYSTTV